jgi:NADH:ubiquinone oxidoreductase subunit H
MASLFNAKLGYSSYIMSDSAVIFLTTVYYKLQFMLDFIYFASLTLYSSLFCSVSVVSFNALVIAFKFLVLIALLIFIRGGIPRYRFDHLTKVG